MQQLLEVGKTAVLVERIISKIVKEGIDIDKILVVTFTNAAASEMRERVLNAIYKKIEEEPDNLNLQRQVTLLNKANISTIHSFCLEVIKNNFYELENFAPNFRIGDEAELILLKLDVLEDLFEKKYEAEDTTFEKLIKTYTSYKDDQALKDLVLKIYGYISSNPFPRRWLDEAIKKLNVNIESNFSNNIWGKILVKDLSEEIEDGIMQLKKALITLTEEDLEPWIQCLKEDISNYATLKERLGDWDTAYITSKELYLRDWPRNKAKSETIKLLKDEAKKIRDSVKKSIMTKVEELLIGNSYEINTDILEMHKTLEKLKELIFEFDDEFTRRKRAKNIIDFGDIEHLTLKILLKEDENGNLCQTDVAKQYVSKFNEIAIDEYQDSNLVQENILTSISNGHNIFMVGDVKQSIYKFRQAMPELFISKYLEYARLDNREKDNGIKIQLFKNFRSRKNVLDFTNLIFQNIMTQAIGDVSYEKEEYLNLGANYPESPNSMKTEIDIIDMAKTEEELEEDENLENLEKIEIESKFIANKIKELIDTKFQVFDNKKGEFRNITYKDIVVLIRNNKGISGALEEQISKLDIPVFADGGKSYLDSTEITMIMSILKVIDNPTDDISLLTVLRSNIFSFTDNDLIEIRLINKYSDFYTAILESKESKVDPSIIEKVEKFLHNLQEWKEASEYLALDELIWKIYADTSLYNFVLLLPNGKQKQANLKMLFEVAKKYESSSFKGVYKFINFIKKIKVGNKDMDGAKIIGETENVVRIMTIHKSKGLEFPVVFLAATSKNFNTQDLKSNILLEQNLGIGVEYIDYDKQIRYDTLTKKAIKLKMLESVLGEEMRLLYVALTRAKEKIYITGTVNNETKAINKMKEIVSMYKKENNKINSVVVKKYTTYLDFIKLAYLYDKEKFNTVATINTVPKSEIITNTKVIAEVSKKESLIDLLNKQKKSEKDIEIKNKIKDIGNILKYQYPNIEDTLIPTKTSVTKIKKIKMEAKRKLEIKEENKQARVIKESKDLSFEEPTFIKGLEENEISATRKGTLMHLCMQMLEIDVNYDLDKVNELIGGLEQRGVITSKEKKVIDANKVLLFTKSFIWQKLKKAKEVYKEKAFYTHIPYNKIEDVKTDAKIIVQGIIDLYFIDENNNIILLDYKSDYIEKGQEQKLVSKYIDQINLYKNALEDSLNRKVYKKYIYSTCLNKVIEIK